MHLSTEFGLTYKTIEQDGFKIDAKVEMLLSSDTPVGIAKSIGLGVIGFADALELLKPDILVLLGDRFEILAAAQAALIALIPLAHIAGGDTTEGAFDEAIRHSITKMAHFHFVTSAVAAQRVKQLGEAPEQIFMVGSPGLDHINRSTFLDRPQLETTLDFTFRDKNILVTFHPVTLEHQSTKVQFEELLTALSNLGPDVGIIITRPNADTGGAVINTMIDTFIAKHNNAKAYTSLGQQRYLSCLAVVDMVVGNSSSGLYEAPSFKIPTINIGERQKGRLQAESVVNCTPKASEIEKAIKAAFSMDCSAVTNPYGEGNSSPKIVAALKTVPDLKKLLKKRFHEVTP
jgi:UDP-N-acetylglucosamine 2-epimerase (non-hydrolysing)/GDP/UDP-N,N'-diacetylbacillosamine 2-epimerase (hydrolysing)